MLNADCILKTRQIIKDTFSNYVIAKETGQNQTITCHYQTQMNTVTRKHDISNNRTYVTHIFLTHYFLTYKLQMSINCIVIIVISQEI